MSRETVYGILDQPWVYGLAQRILAPGAEAALTRRLQDLVSRLPRGEPILDLGCGPRSWLANVGLEPQGLDINPTYVAAYRAAGGEAVVASAAEIPFADGTFAGVWSVGVLHHLPDAVAAKVVREAMRVSRTDGYVAILDAVLPTTAWRRPLASAIRSLDRGEHMRSEADLRALFAGDPRWQFSRFTYAATGLEMLACVRKP
jgi:SAM-dependent methyltransferase